MDIKRIFTIYITVVFLSGSIAIADLNQGLVAHYPFNGNANNEGENGFNGVINGATLVTDRFGNSQGAYNFDGDDYIQFDAPVQDTSPPYSVSLWFKYDSVPEKNEYLISNGGETSDSQGFFFLIRGSLQVNCGRTFPPGAIQFGIASQVDNIRIAITASVPPGQWHHVVAYWNRATETPQLYVDGQLAINDVCFSPTPIFGSQNNMRIGAPSKTLEYSLNGKIDDIRIYNRALSESEINELYQGKTSCTTLESGTVASNLDIYMPSLNYQTLLGVQNIWADLEYKGTNSAGQHTWGLKDFGVNQ